MSPKTQVYAILITGVFLIARRWILLTASSQGYEGSPFGFHQGDMAAPGYPGSGFFKSGHIGDSWQCLPDLAIWLLLQANLNASAYETGRAALVRRPRSGPMGEPAGFVLTTGNFKPYSPLGAPWELLGWPGVMSMRLLNPPGGHVPSPDREEGGAKERE